MAHGTATQPTSSAPIRVLDARVVCGHGGGPEKTILRSPGHLDPSQVWMAAAYLHPAGDSGVEGLKAAADRYGCPLYLIPERGPVDLRAARRLLQLCRDLDIDLYHGHDYKTNLLGLWLAKRHPMRLVTTAHGWVHYTWRTRIYYAMEKRALRHYSHAIAVSEDLRQTCVRHGVPHEDTTVVINGIDCDEFQRARTRDDAKAELGLDPSRLHLGFVGRLSDEKRVDEGIRLVHQLSARFPGLTLHVVGDGPRRAELESLAAELGVAEQIRFHGWLSQAKTYFEAFDLFLLPSSREGTPNALLEAMAMGAPAAATRVGGVDDMLDGGRCGLLLEPEVTSDWTEHIAALLADAAERDRLARLAREHVQREFSFARRTAIVSDVYHRVMGIEPAQTAPARAA